MISKELLYKILGDVDYRIQDGKVYFEKVSENGIPYLEELNIHELAHKCKEWVESKGYSIMSRPKSFNQKSIDARAFVVIEEEYKNCTFRLNALNFDNFEASSEPEAIFKACEWILKEEV